MRQIVLDIETTGLRVDEGNRILEIAAIEVIDRKIASAHLHFYINPERDSEEGALAIHGLSSAFLADKPRFAEIVDTLLDFVQDTELIIHNAPFDIGFLNMELNRLGLEKMGSYVSNVLDTLAMAKGLYPGKRNNLDALCDRLKINRSKRLLHGALIDCELLAEVYLALTRGQDSLLMDLHVPNKKVSMTAQTNMVEPYIRHFKVIHPNEEELKAHDAYLTALDQQIDGPCIWRTIEKQSS